MGSPLKSTSIRRCKWNSTSRSVDRLRSLLKCVLCQEIVKQPYVVGSCEHMFCKECISPFLGKYCPECKLPADAKEMQQDIVMTDIVSKASQLSKALGRYSLRSKGDERSPFKCESPSPPSSPSRLLHLNGGRNKEIDSPQNKMLGTAISSPVIRRRGRPPSLAAKNHVAVASPKTETSSGHKALVVSPTFPSPHAAERVKKRKTGPLSKGGSIGKGDKKPCYAPVSPTLPLSPEELPAHKNSKKDTHLQLTPVKKQTGMVSPPTPTTPGGFTLKKNSKGETPLHLATIKGEINVVRDLLDQGANPNVKDNAGWTPLHEACHHGHMPLVELLLSRGALVNLPGFENETALHDAVVMNEPAIAALLVSKGANKQARNSRGLTPMDLAVGCTSEMKKALKTPCSQSSDSNEILANQQPPAFVQTNVVLLGTGLDLKQQRDLLSCAEILNGKVVTEFCDQVTHLITVCDEEGRCQRTLKFLMAILKGKWILNYTWVDECIAFNRKVFEEPFEIVGAKQHSMINGPRHARTNNVNQFPPLFDGCSFYLDGNFVTPSLGKENLAMLIRSGGGSVLTRDPRRHISNAEAKVIPYHAPPNGSLSNVHYFVVSQNGPAEIRNSVCCISSAWLLACISTFKLLPHSFEEK